MGEGIKQPTQARLLKERKPAAVLTGDRLMSYMNTTNIPHPRCLVNSKRCKRMIGPLPTFWLIKGRFYGSRIDNLPQWYVTLALGWPSLRPELRAALLAVSGLRVLANDQREGR